MHAHYWNKILRSFRGCDDDRKLPFVCIEIVRDLRMRVASISTWSSGGYARALAPGAYDIVSTDPRLGDPVRYSNVLMGTQNVKLDFRSATVLVGDLNGDALVNNFDIDPFALVLTDPAGYRRQFASLGPLSRGDINGDSRLDNLDIDRFASLLAGAGPTAAVPEPAAHGLILAGVAAAFMVCRRQKPRSGGRFPFRPISAHSSDNASLLDAPGDCRPDASRNPVQSTLD